MSVGHQNVGRNQECGSGVGHRGHTGKIHTAHAAYPGFHKGPSRLEFGPRRARVEEGIVTDIEHGAAGTHDDGLELVESERVSSVAAPVLMRKSEGVGGRFGRGGLTGTKRFA